MFGIPLWAIQVGVAIALYGAGVLHGRQIESAAYTKEVAAVNLALEGEKQKHEESKRQITEQYLAAQKTVAKDARSNSVCLSPSRVFNLNTVR